MKEQETSKLNNDNIYKTLKSTRNILPKVISNLCLEEEKLESWKNVLDNKLIPQMDPNFPLIVAVCGGGSSGKSTLFNSLIKKKVSSAGGKAGLSRRVLIAIHPEQLQNKKVFNNLFQPFGTIPKKLERVEELTEPGDPLYIADESVPKDIILLDTPDFDTGYDDKYINRNIAQKVLETSSILIYIFTNSNYNNRENKKFISEILHKCGYRKSILVYRCSKSYNIEEVIEHTETVGKHIYDNEHKKHILAIYRTDENDDVAAGNKYMKFKAIEAEFDDISELFKSLDSRTLRKEEFVSSLNKYIEFLENVSSKAKISLKKLEIYTDICKIIESHAIAKALKSFPAKKFTEKLTEAWEATSPTFTRIIRRTGKTFALPGKGLLWIAKKFKEELLDDKKEIKEEINIKDIYSNNLLEAANDFRNKLLSEEIRVMASKNDINVNKILNYMNSISDNKFYYENCENNYNLIAKTHSALENEKQNIRSRDLDKLHEECEDVIEELKILPDFFENEVTEMVKEFREKMDWKKKMREFLLTSVNVVPATIAVSYVLLTYDPVTATGVYAKLQGLFGLNDLYALIALPASTGLNKLDRIRLEKKLKPVLEKWFNFRKDEIKAFLRQKISGNFFDETEKLKQENKKLIKKLDAYISTLKEFTNE